MSRSTFGTWGLALDDVQFARALAAVGVLQAANLPDFSWTEAEIGPALQQVFDAARDVPDQTTNTPRVPWEAIFDFQNNAFIAPTSAAGGELPRLLAEAWDRITDTSRARLEISSFLIGLPFLPWLIQQLSQPEVYASSVYTRYEDEEAAARWNWPLRTGLLDDPQSRKLHDLLGSRAWPDLSEVRYLSRDEESCDLLLLPWSLRESSLRVAQLAAPVQAQLLMVLGGMHEPWPEAIPFISILLNETDAAGICISTIPVDGQRQWYNDLIEELSHNHFLDVALQRSVAIGRPPLYFFTTAQLLVNSHLSHLSQRMVDRLADLPSGTPLDFPFMPSIPESKSVASEFADQLRSEIKRFRYDSEQGDARYFARLAQDTQPFLNAAEARTQPARWAQAVVREADGAGAAAPVQKALRGDTSYQVELFVGPVEPQITTLVAPEAFPEELLPPEAVEYRLTVIFSEPDHAPRPQRATIVLPRSGRSSSCHFYLHTLPGDSDFQARIIILHRNRVLQTALLRARVFSDSQQAPANARMTLAMETVIMPRLQGLETRRRFDAAFVFNEGSSGAHSVTAVGKDQAVYFPLAGMQPFQERIDRKLAEIALYPSAFPKKLRAAEGEAASEAEELLLFLALHGHSFFRALQQQLGAESKILTGERIQIVSALDSAFVPLEFVYAYPPPAKTARICPNAESALLDGECANCLLDRSNHNQQAAYVCPFGFWGMSKVIERQTSNRGKAEGDIPQPAEYTLTAAPVDGRKVLNPFSAAVCGLSDKVDNYQDPDSTQKQSERVIAALNRLMPGQVKTAETWLQWEAQIRAQKPSLLVLMPHTVTDEDLEMIAMLIGHDDRLLVEHIFKQHVRANQEAAAPIVLLMGCATMIAGEADIPFQSLVSQFRQKGAAVVVSTRNKIRSRHSVPVFEDIIDILNKLLQEQAESRSFGDVMLALRRQAVAEGLLMVLCLFAYGDADWQLVPS